jgi:hypothetical protein
MPASVPDGFSGLDPRRAQRNRLIAPRISPGVARTAGVHVRLFDLPDLAAFALTIALGLRVPRHALDRRVDPPCAGHRETARQKRQPTAGELRSPRGCRNGAGQYSWRHAATGCFLLSPFRRPPGFGFFVLCSLGQVATHLEALLRSDLACANRGATLGLPIAVSTGRGAAEDVPLRIPIRVMIADIGSLPASQISEGSRFGSWTFAAPSPVSGRRRDLLCRARGCLAPASGRHRDGWLEPPHRGVRKRSS